MMHDIRRQSGFHSAGRTVPRRPEKLWGAYPQRQDGLYMQRIPIFAGRLSPEQLKIIAQLAEQYTNGTPLHLTTRQDIELHNLPAEHIHAVQKVLYGCDLPTFGAGGDCLRNITVCPCCRFNRNAYDVQPLGEHIREFLLGSELITNMPRKFKISLAGCRLPQSKPFVNDLSFIAIDETTVRVIGAGSLGPRPETGIVLFEALPVVDVLPLTAAALRFFAEHGERKNRRRARFRHIRERFGDAVFLKMLKEYFREAKDNSDWPSLKLEKGLAGWDHKVCLQVPKGELDVQDARALARAAGEQGAGLCINLTHGIAVFSQDPFALPQRLKPLTQLPCIIACPGNTTCTNGLTNCPQLAAELTETLKPNETLRGKTIALSGCPNNCAHSSIADIGLSGMMKTIDGTRREVYQILLNGGNGITDKQAKRGRIIPADEAVAFVKNL